MVDVAWSNFDKLEGIHIDEIKSHLCDYVSENMDFFWLDKSDFPEHWENRIAKAVERKSVSTRIDWVQDFLEKVFSNPISVYEIPGLENYNFTISLAWNLLAFEDRKNLSADSRSSVDWTSDSVSENISWKKYPTWLSMSTRPLSVILKNTYDTSSIEDFRKFISLVRGSQNMSLYLRNIERFFETIVWHINWGFNNNFSVSDIREIRLSDDYLCTFVFHEITKVYHLPNKLWKIIEEDDSTIESNEPSPLEWISQELRDVFIMNWESIVSNGLRINKRDEMSEDKFSLFITRLNESHWNLDSDKNLKHFLQQVLEIAKDYLWDDRITLGDLFITPYFPFTYSVYSPNWNFSISLDGTDVKIR